MHYIKTNIHPNFQYIELINKDFMKIYVKFQGFFQT